MDVLFVTSHFGSDENVGFMPLVGAELCRRGHDVRGLQYGEVDTLDVFPIDQIETRALRPPHWINQWLLYRDWKSKVRSYLSYKSPDIVVTDRQCMIPTIDAANELGIPTVGVIPGLGFSRFDPYDFRECKTPRFFSAPLSVKLQYPFVRSLFRQHKRVLADATSVVVISEFLRTVMRETFERETELVYTPVHLDDVRVDSHSPEYLTIINPRTALKGSELTITLAEELPDHKLLIAGTFAAESHAERASELENVHHLGWVDDMRNVYEKSKVVLVPSLVEEGGGPRVVIEGFANGIPAVGTNRGAIPEHIQDAGALVTDPHDISEWSSCIEKVLSNRAELAEKALRYVERYDANRQIDTFEQVLDRSID
jgi:glycosyltransferase involved in cell wall biosynthesis